MKYQKIAILSIMFFFTIFCYPSVASASTGPTDQYYLTIEDAYELALKNSSSLKGKVIDIDRSEEVLSATGNKVSYIPTGPARQDVAQAYIGLTMANLSAQMAKKTKTIEEDITYLKVVTQYTKIIESQDKYNYAVKTLANAKIKHSQSAVACTVGSISEYQFNQANYGLSKAQLGLNNAELELQTAVTSFKDLLGIRDDSTLVLTDKPGFFPIQDKSVETRISKTIKESPVIWLAEQQSSLKELELMLHDFTNPLAEPYKAKEMDVKKAELGTINETEKLRSNIRKLYNQMTQLEEAYNLQTRELEVAQENMQIKKLMFEVGVATQIEVEDAKLEVNRLSLALDTTTYQYEILKLMYEKPWIYTEM